MYEAIVDEIRKQQLDLAARTKFVEPGEEIFESRRILNDLLEPPKKYIDPELAVVKSASKLEGMAREGWIEEG